VSSSVDTTALAATARRWRRASAHRGEEDAAAPGIAPEDARRLERDMAGYDL